MADAGRFPSRRRVSTAGAKVPLLITRLPEWFILDHSAAKRAKSGQDKPRLLRNSRLLGGGDPPPPSGRSLCGVARDKNVPLQLLRRRPVTGEATSGRMQCLGDVWLPSCDRPTPQQGHSSAPASEKRTGRRGFARRRSLSSIAAVSCIDRTKCRNNSHRRDRTGN